MEVINRERFEAWLQQQPDERQWDYGSITDCALCSFLKESGFKATVGGETFTLWPNNYPGDIHPIPPWTYKLLWDVREWDNLFFTAKALKATYVTLFPDSPLAQPKPQPQWPRKAVFLCPAMPSEHGKVLEVTEHCPDDATMPYRVRGSDGRVFTAKAEEVNFIDDPEDDESDDDTPSPEDRESEREAEKGVSVAN